jgi:chitodextrinase
VVAATIAAAAAAPAGAAVTVDAKATGHQSANTSTVATPALATHGSNELLVAFLSADGPSSARSQSFSSVTGGSLTWTLRRRVNDQAGTAEIWTAVAPRAQSGIVVTGRHSGSYRASITVVAFAGADVGVQGAVAGASGPGGAPAASLMTTRSGSSVWAAGTDWDNPIPRVTGAGQVKDDEFLAPSGDTYWVQHRVATTGAPGPVTIDDSSPTGDRWDLALIEVLPLTPDTSPPTAPGSLTARATSATSVALGWTAASDDVGVTGYTVVRDGRAVGTTDSTSYTDTSAAPGTTYSYVVRAVDAAGNTSADSAPASVTTPAADTTPPSVALTAPADDATVSGSVALSATASDDAGVAGVQFLLDGSPIGAEDTTAPYAATWASAGATNGAHTLSARARDTAGNLATATAVHVTVANTAPASLTIDASTPPPTGVGRTAPSTTSAAFAPPAASVLYAVFSLDAAAGSNNVVTSVSNTGTPLTWHLLGRENHSNGTTIGGDVEVWWAASAQQASPITVTATFTQPTKDVPAPLGLFEVLVIDGAASDQSGAASAAKWLIAGTDSHPQATVTTTVAGARVFAVFDDWNSGSTPVAGAGQEIQSMVLNATDVDGYWIQDARAATASPGPVLMDATIPDRNEWHALAWEVRPAP